MSWGGRPTLHDIAVTLFRIALPFTNYFGGLLTKKIILCSKRSMNFYSFWMSFSCVLRCWSNLQIGISLSSLWHEWIMYEISLFYFCNWMWSLTNALFVSKYPNNGNGGKGTRMYIFCVLPPGEGRHFSAMLFMEKLLISTMWTTKQDWNCLYMNITFSPFQRKVQVSNM